MTNMNTNTTTKANKTTQTIVVRERVVVEAEGKSTNGHRKPLACWKADGSEIRKFASMKDAAEALEVDPTAISYAVRHKQTCKGYKICTLAEMDVYMDEMITDMNAARRFDRIVLENDLKVMEAKGRYHRNSKPVVCIETKEMFHKLSDAAQHFNYRPADIRNVIIGKAKTYRGMHFCYLSEYEETVRKLEEERIEAERKAEEEKKRKEEEKRQREIEKLEAKLKRRNEISSRLATEYVRSLELAKEMEAELKALREKEVAYDLQNNTH